MENGWRIYRTAVRRDKRRKEYHRPLFTSVAGTLRDN
jgi:hypothetical protein